MSAEQPELRSERVSTAVTPSEKRALDVVARVRPDLYDGPSTVLRDMSLTEAVEYAARIEAAFASAGA